MEVLNQVFFSELQSKIALMYECMKGHAVEHHSDMWQGPLRKQINSSEFRASCSGKTKSVNPSIA